MEYFVEYKNYVAGMIHVPDDIKQEDVYDFLKEQIGTHNAPVDINPKTGGYCETIIDDFMRIDC